LSTWTIIWYARDAKAKSALLRGVIPGSEHVIWLGAHVSVAVGDEAVAKKAAARKVPEKKAP
jgi:hypothetical protein